MSMTPRPGSRLCLLYGCVAACVAMGIARGSARHFEIAYDEQVDLDIVEGLRAAPLRGEEPAIDASQTRLPMYLTALAFAVSGREDLSLARDISLLAGGITLVAAAALSHALFGTGSALLSVTILSLSPYFLSFIRIAMTEGDAVFGCLMTLAALAFTHYLRRQTPGRWLACGLLLGLAAGAKVFAPVLFLVFAVMECSTPPAEREPHAWSSLADGRRLGGALAAGVLAMAGTVLLARWSPSAAPAGWALVLALWVCVVALVLRRGVMPAKRVGRQAGMFAISLLTWGALMPVHLTQHAILHEIVRRILRWDNRVPLALWSDHLRLYAGILLVKLTVPLGLLTAGSLVYAAVRERTDGRFRLGVLTFVFYVVFLCLLPLRQTFYLMGIYPLMVVVTAGFMVEAWAWASRRWTLPRAAGPVAAVLLLVHLGLSLHDSYPWLHLHGYRTVGNRWMGAESRGYRNLIQTPSDGVASLVEWCATSPKVHRGDRVVSYLWEERILDRLVPADAPYLLIRRGLSPDEESPGEQPSIAEADFVLLHINNLLGYGDRPPDWPPGGLLAAQFEVVHTVHRGPVDVAWVYARREYVAVGQDESAKNP